MPTFSKLSCLFACLTVSSFAVAQPAEPPDEPPPAPRDEPPALPEGDAPAAPTTLPPPPAAPAGAQPSGPTGYPPAQPPPQGYGQPGYPPPPPYYGYGPPPPPPKPPAPKRDLSLTISPFHLFFPIVEAMAELRLLDGAGLAVLGGYGTMNTASLPGGGNDTLTVYEVGGQLAFYPLESFEGLLVGAEVMWIGVDADDDNDSSSDTAKGLAIGPMLGYKHMADSGFTLIVQGGIEYVSAKAEEDGTQTDEESGFIPLLNFNLGWSF